MIKAAKRISISAFMAIFLAVSFIAAEEPSNVEKIRKEIQTEWSQLENFIKENDYTGVNESFNQLQQLKIQSGINEFVDYSEKLFAYSELLLSKGDKENSKYFARKALELSPESPWLIINNSGLLVRSGIYNHLTVFGNLIKIAVRRMDFILFFLIKLIYPVLWSLTLSALLCCLLYFVTKTKDISEAVTNKIRFLKSKIISSIFILATLLVPLYAGPVWALIAYSIFIYVFSPRQKKFAALMSILVILWTSAIPIRENLNTWISSEAVKSYLRIYSGVYSADDLAMISKYIDNNPQDYMAYFTYAKLLRREGKLELSEKIFNQLRTDIKDKFSLDFEIGIINFLLGDYAKADLIFQDLNKEAPQNAEMLFNFSKIKFQQLDTEESRRLFDLSYKIKPALAEKLKEQENLLGILSPLSLAENNLSVSYLARAMFVPVKEIQPMIDKISAILFYGFKIKEISYIGFSLLTAYLFVGMKKKSKEKKRGAVTMSLLFRVVRILPGGSSIIREKMTSGFLLIAMLVLLTMPLLNWPGDLSNWLIKFSGLELYYTYFYCFFIAAVCCAG